MMSVNAVFMNREDDSILKSKGSNPEFVIKKEFLDLLPLFAKPEGFLALIDRSSVVHSIDMPFFTNIQGIQFIPDFLLDSSRLREDVLATLQTYATTICPHYTDGVTGETVNLPERLLFLSIPLQTLIGLL